MNINPEGISQQAQDNGSIPLIVVVGPTATGKTALALDLAGVFGGEIICADSRTIYRGMDVGTAKPTQEEQAHVPHHLIDIANPDETFSAAEFKARAINVMKDIYSRNQIPIMVGGTGLYIDSVIFDYTFGDKADQSRWAELTKMTVEQLQREISRNGLAIPENRQNKRYLIRTLERNGNEPNDRKKMRANTIIIGVNAPRDILEIRIRKRVEMMIDSGFITEVKQLLEKYDPSVPGLNAPGYKAFVPYVENRVSLEEATNQFVANDLRLAKRQLTWFKRNKSIHWINDRSEAVDIVTTFLNNL